MKNPRRVSFCVAFLGLLWFWVHAGCAPWLQERAEGSQRAGSRYWDAPARVAARAILRGGALTDAARAERLLEHSLNARPLYAPTWLTSAELALRQGDRSRAARRLEMARALWPRRGRLLWSVAMLQAELGDPSAALATLETHLRAEPETLYRVLWVAQRLEPSPERLVAALVPRDRLAPDAAANRLEALLRQAWIRGDGPLAGSVWRALSAQARQEPGALDFYVETLVRTAQADEAVRLWRQAHPAQRGLTNPGFEAPLRQGGLGWRVQAPEGASWRWDEEVHRRGDHSLRIGFDGSANLSYGHASQVAAVLPGKSYVLSGYWRGLEVTTRSGPYLEIVSLPTPSMLRARTQSGVGSWEWRRFELGFQVPERTRLIEIRVRRDPVSGHGAAISGAVWFDELTLEAPGSANG